jgi:hypothetical protein
MKTFSIIIDFESALDPEVLRDFVEKQVSQARTAGLKSVTINKENASIVAVQNVLAEIRAEAKQRMKCLDFRHNFDAGQDTALNWLIRRTQKYMELNPALDSGG